MSHQIGADLLDLTALAAALQDLQHYTGAGGYELAGVSVEGTRATWRLEVRKAVQERPAAAAAPAQRRREVEPGDQVIVETKAQQLNRRFGDAPAAGVEGIVFRVLTRGPHPRGMKVELRDRTVGRVQKNLSAPGAGEPGGRR